MLQRKLNADLIEAGCDEAGRGCLAGPVFAAAVMLPDAFEHPLLNDSKKLSASQREKLRLEIESKTHWAVASCTPAEIDKINILQASIKAMHRALKELYSQLAFEHIAVDGNRFKPFNRIPHSTVVKGDGKLMHIAAASILAKTHRDDYMLKIHQEFPEFGWNQNKGYPTATHREILKSLGPTPYHRKSFGPVAAQLDIFATEF